MLPAFALLAACDPFGSNNTVNPPEPSPAETEGWKPVYATKEATTTIESQSPRTIEKAGKIYVKGHMLYQVEAGKGIHVIDISNPNAPQKVRFIQVTGAQEVAIMNNYLYTNNVNDLVALNISDINNVTVSQRVKGVFHLVDGTLPPSSGWFECVDASKGEVVGWELVTLNKPVCRKN